MPFKNSLPPEQRFWPKVDKTPGHGPQGECWVWIGSKKDGYGRFPFGKSGWILAHRFSFEIAYAQKPKHRVLHHCDNPSCVRPSHLYDGTDLDNVRDMYKRGRAAAKLTISQVREIRAILKAKGRSHRPPTHKQIAELFGVAKHTIDGINQRGRWLIALD